MFKLSEFIKGRVFFIAEVGCNFENNFNRAKEMVRAAAAAGVDAVKFQTFIPEKLASKHAQKFWDIEGCPGKTQLEEFQQMFRLNYEQYMELKDEAEKLGLIFFSTPSDEESADLLEKVEVPLFKLGSMDITHLPLLKHIARKGKPMILSTGASTAEEIEEAVEVIKKENNSIEIALLHCISNYPTRDENVNLRMITDLRKKFPPLLIGYSDHTLPKNGEGILVAAVALGACILEKHFTYNNRRPGYDHEISADYDGLKNLVAQVRRVEKSLGVEYKQPIEAEKKSRMYARRSLVAAEDIPAGAILTSKMIQIKRPGTGIAPKYFEAVIGKKVKVDISADSVLFPDLIKDFDCDRYEQ